MIVYEPESFIPLALLRWREGEDGGRGNDGEKAGDGAIDALPELPTGFPLDWADLPERSPQAWRNVVAMRRKSAAQLGQGGAGSAGGHGKHPRPEAEVLYFHTDHLGTPRELTDREGRIVWSARYRAWGATLAIEQPLLPELRRVGNAVQETWQEQTDPVVQNLRFQGQYFDAETGLHYNRFRYYDPDCGRFVSQDPIGLEGGVNLYQYAPNPVGWVDPLGLKKRCQTKKNSTEPALPEKIIASDKGMRLEHYVRSGDHAPAHFHLRGEGGVNIQIGQNGKPIDSKVQLSAAQQDFVERNKAILRRSVDKIQRWHSYQNLPGDCSCRCS